MRSAILVQESFLAAEELMDSNDGNWPETVADLRRRGKLVGAIQGLNALLHDPRHSTRAQAAIQRIGLSRGG